MDWTVMQRHCTAKEGQTPPWAGPATVPACAVRAKPGGHGQVAVPAFSSCTPQGGHCYVHLVCAPTEPGTVETASTHCCMYCAPGCVLQLSLDGRCSQALCP